MDQSRGGSRTSALTDWPLRCPADQSQGGADEESGEEEEEEEEAGGSGASAAGGSGVPGLVPGTTARALGTPAWTPVEDAVLCAVVHECGANWRMAGDALQVTSPRLTSPRITSP